MFINYLSLVFTRVKNLIPCLLSFWNASGRFNPYLPFKFLIFYHSCVMLKRTLLVLLFS